MAQQKKTVQPTKTPRKSSRKEKLEKAKEDNVVEKYLEDIGAFSRGYNGNSLLKSAGEVIQFTPEHIKELKKCKDDPVYFAEQYIKIVHVDKGKIPIKLYDYQKKIIYGLKDNRFSVVLSCRQSGKCHCINTVIRVRHPSVYDGLPFNITVGAFYEWQNFRRFYGERGI